MRPTRLLPLAAVLAAATVAGCGSSSSSNSTSAPAAATSASTPATSASTPATAPAAAGVAITMKNIAFDPKAVTVKKGQKITWTNGEAVPHNVTATSGASFKSALLDEGKTFSFTPTKAGTIEYTCTIHPGMNGTITVQ
jgi:plastocyanin